MAKIVVVGAGLAGMSVAFELRATLGPSPGITVIGDGERFSFTPSNPWLAVGWRKPEQFTLPAGEALANKQIAFVSEPVARIDAAARSVTTAVGQQFDYDYLVICTGPRLAFEEVPGLGPAPGHTQSVCTTPHAASHHWQLKLSADSRLPVPR